MRGPISPDKFIGLAEECGMIGKIGEFVLSSAVESRQLARTGSDRGQPLANPVQRPHIVDTVAAVLSEFDFKPSRLELEITEGVFLATATPQPTPSRG